MNPKKLARPFRTQDSHFGSFGDNDDDYHDDIEVNFTNSKFNMEHCFINSRTLSVTSDQGVILLPTFIDASSFFFMLFRIKSRS